MIAVIAVALVALVVTAAALRIAQSGRAAKRAAARAAAPITAPGSITPGTTATVFGTVRVDPDRVLTSPLGAARTVAFRVAIHEQTSSAAHLLLELRDSVPFVVEGAHGHATIGGEPRFEYAGVERNPDHGAAVTALLETKGTSFERERLLWSEERIEDGAEVLVTGQVAHSRGGDERGGAFRGTRAFTISRDVLVVAGDAVTRARALEADAAENARLARIFAVIALVLWVLVAVLAWAS